ncbi:hypothetical protein ACOSP7_022241 [Xanthoceras sorbifolium]
MNAMEYEQVHCFVEPSYLEEFQYCSLESTFSLQVEESISPNTTTPDDILNNDQDLERLLQIETDLLEFSSINQDTEMGPEICRESTQLGHEMIQEAQEKVHVLREENDSPLKGIQEELMDEGSVTDLLLMGAEAVEAQNWPLSSIIITKLRSLLIDRENGDNPFNRLALFFTQGLHYKSTDAPGMMQDPVSKQGNTMSSFQILQGLSPCVKFAHFTANQAILEATQGDSEIHVIDFDIMDGVQWPPFMVDLSMRKDVSLRVTAIITDPQNQAIVHQTGRRLKEFSDSINFPFEFDQVVMEKEEDFEGIKTYKTLIANCMIHQLHMPKTSFSLVKTFLSGMTKLSPKMVVLVEEELFSFSKIPSMSFVDFFCEALHHYTALFDSLLSSFSRKRKMGIRQIEEFLVFRILDSLRQFPRENKERIPWGDGFASLSEFKPITLSSWNISQAKLLVHLFSGGYWVQHEKCRLILCWKSRPLTTASIWVPISKSS